MKRNLLFHLYPLKGSIWKWHVERLIGFRNVWNGRRIVMVAVDESTDPIDDVRSALAPLDSEIVVHPNSPAFGETAHFVEGLSMLESKDPNEATFYAHAKGVTHKKDPSPAKAWSDAMYDLNLKRVELIEKILEESLAVGCFRQQMDHCGSSWHYSGTFFWLKHSGIFSRSWKEIVRDRYGVEAYPGRHISFVESSSLTPDGISPGQLYKGNVSCSTVKEFEAALDYRIAFEKKPIYGFMHIACMNHWFDIVASQIWKIQESGLLEATRKIYWGILGDPGSLLFNPTFMAKVEVGFRSQNLELFEFPTLAMLDKVCREQDCTVWYIHTKGVSCIDQRSEPFRNHLERCGIEGWRKCLSAIRDGHDAAGAIWQPNRSFLGNFWWSSSSHIRDLVPVGQLNWTKRGNAEGWLTRLNRKRPFKMASLLPWKDS